ncbi:3'-5' exoribonuclease HELZ2-like isoform X4 [Montipora capricornis]|uniref:3'-5' exoribonuclease HELZ2-like isoform X4 n=1 Tax=Montipora capricornis TaxID=246305 RepID=UPI0035F115C5
MPTFSDIERGSMSDYTKSSSRQTQAHKLPIAKSAIRPRPTWVLGSYQLCWQFKRRQTCSGGQKCTFAHGENERIAWEEDRKKVKKKVKNVKANDGSSLLKDVRVAFRGPANCRAPLTIPGNGGKYRMCPKWPEGKCKLDKRCTLAHGKEELKAWNEHLENINKRKKEESVKKNARQKNDLTANVPLPNDVPVKRLAPNYKLDELVPSVAGVTVSYEPQELDVSLQIPFNSEGKMSHSWTIRVNYESRGTGHVQDVVLLPHHHKCYTLSSAKFKCSVPSSSGEPVEVKLPESYVLRNDLHYALKPHLPPWKGSYELEINVTFSTLVFGNFAQVLVLDFGRDSAHLAVKMNVEVGSQEFWQEYGEEKAKLTLDWTLWDDGSRKIVKFEPKQPLPFNNYYLLDMYKLPREDEMVPCPLFDKGQGLRPENYKNVMHQLSFIEDFYIRKQIARFNVHQVPSQAAKRVVKKEEVLCAQEGWLYGSFHVARPITPDDADGRLMLRNLFRSLGTVLLAKSEGDSVIYEALVDSVEDSRVILKLSQRCCKELDLSDNSCVTVDIQFHINRLAFCEMHDNIDRLGREHFRILFPELGNSSSQQEIYPLTWILDKKLNDDQKEIIRKIAAPANDAPPLVVFGPFGTGNTYTLNQTIRRIAVNQDNRVLICAHSNSAADLHVLLLDTYLKNPDSIRACKPLRIYTPLRKLSTVSETVKEYCLIADKGTSNQVFKLPTRDDVIGHRVVISTLGMSRALFDMNLRHGFFSHILIDEAAQALETETLTPLTLAGNKTKVDFTGDHMQTSSPSLSQEPVPVDKKPKKDELETKNHFPTFDAKTAFEASGSPCRKKSDQQVVNRAVNFGGARPKQRQTSTVKDDSRERRLGGGNSNAALNKKDKIVKDRGYRQSNSVSQFSVSLPRQGHSTGEALSLNDRSSSCSSSKQTDAAAKETSRNAKNPKSKQDESRHKSRKGNEHFDFHGQRGKVKSFERHTSVEDTSRLQRPNRCSIGKRRPTTAQMQAGYNHEVHSTPRHSIRGSLIIHDTRQARPRSPPTGVCDGNFQLCKWRKSGRVCKTGRFCIFAHSQDELRFWMENHKKSNSENTSTSTVQEPTSQRRERTADISGKEMVYSLPGVQISSDKPSAVQIIPRCVHKGDKYEWTVTLTFEIRDVGMLRGVDLTHRYHNCYRLTRVSGCLNGERDVFVKPNERWSCTLPDLGVTSGQVKIEVSVLFETKVSIPNRTFTQCLRFDFGTKKPYLLHGFNVDVAHKDTLDTISATREELKLDPEVWTETSVEVVVSSRVAASVEETTYQLPSRIENVVSAQVVEVNLTEENYQRAMHQLLFTEEIFMKKAISRFILRSVPLQTKKSVRGKRSEMIFAEKGELFGVLTFEENGAPQPDYAAGRLLIRNIQTAWLRLASSNSSKVCEALVERADITGKTVVLKLSSRICSELQLNNDGEKILVDVQFQLNRQPLCEMHAAIDKLGLTQRNLLFPKPSTWQVTHEEYKFSDRVPLDEGQRDVVSRILSTECNPRPLVVFGPFGTGKTFTLHQAICELVRRSITRILLCTHTNSAADLHVELLNNYLTNDNGLRAAKPLRIYHVERRLDADSKVAKNYTLIENGTYKLPTREDVIDHRVVITTLAVSKHLLDLQLNRGFFTHILVDEAAQALEPEALTPLVLAGPNTKIVLTGDHMQMKPEVYSHFARDWGLQCSLPERLFDHYYQMKPEVYRENVMFLTKNYRCHPEILQFPSDNFYGEGLIPCSTEAAHPRLKPLMFFSVCGLEEARDNSYVNSAEASEIVKRVKELSDDWPVEWGEKDLSKIGVISASYAQVKTIRMLLRRNEAELRGVTVESIYNIQGKEFRAVFISTVRTFLTCQRSNGGSGSDQQHYWEFLSDATLLNTAITRAKSLVAVVGEPVSLYTVGECRGNWRDYIRRCADRDALYGISYEELLQQVDAYLRGIPLNPQAATFVPKGMAQIEKEVCNPIESVNRQNEESENPKGLGKSKDREHEISDFPTGEQNMEKESSEDEDELDEGSESEGDDPSIKDETTYQTEHHNGTLSQDTSDLWGTPNFFDKFCRERYEDESVFPRYMDEIIKALVEKCAEIKGRDAEYPSLETAKLISGRRTSKAEKPRAQEKQGAFSGVLSSTGYHVTHINGRKVAFLDVDLRLSKSSRTQRLTAQAPSRQNDYLDAEILEDLLRKQPAIYIPCNLRLGSESFRSAYGVVSDTKTPDIKVKGRIRGVFDMDRVVIEKKGSSKHFEPCFQGKIVGVLNHIISPHERQYVCRVDPENPECMFPINKSVPKIVTLRAKDVDGMPIYKEMHDGDDKKLRVKVMGFKTFCSGKYLFLVQYLQWRSDCSTPLGIIIGKLPQINTLEAGMEILFAEHGIRKPFDEESKLEVRRKFPTNWSVPYEEYQTRQKIEGAFTIDPETSKDLDDALTVEQIEGSVYRIGVHIADVSFFVEEGTALDKDAFFRCTSYYPGHDYESVPMLPPELSGNHCSLLPGMDRLSVSVFLDLSDKGELVAEPTMKRTIVRSCCRLSYGDAQNIIDGQDCTTQRIPFDTAENIRSLSFLAQRRRFLRLRGASFDHWSNCDHDPENFKAHEMVEEMMILANQQVANRLFTERPDVTPLRVQLPPKEHRLKEWTEKYGQYMKYLLFIRGFYSEETLTKMTREVKVSEAAEFKVQQSVWQEICDAEKANDQAKLQFLICNESHHPQLVVANCEFRRLQPKAQYACSVDQRDEKNVHFSMGMSHYTHFTSPIRRFIDIQVHRILLGLIQESHGSEKISKDQVGKVCRRSTFAQENSRKFDKGCKKVQVAAKLKVRSQKTKAVLSLIENNSICLEILDQEYNQLSANQRRIKLSKLKPIDTVVNKDLTEIELTWKQRLYVAPQKRSWDGSQTKSEKDEVNNLLANGMGEKKNVLDLPVTNWLQILRAVQEENFKELRKLIRKTDADCVLRQRAQQRGFNHKKAETKDSIAFFYEMRLALRKFDVVNVQLTAQMKDGVLHPEVQLFMVSPNFHICIEHQNYPKHCFATTSRSKASKRRYESVEHYIRAWEPVLAMEAATGAVEENDKFTIHNLELQWTKHSGAKVEVSFSLPKEYCSDGQIEFYDGDFVCVRVCKDQYMTHSEHLIAGPESTSDVSEYEPTLPAPKDYSFQESSDDCSSYWVGHCVIQDVTKSKDEPDILEVKMDLHRSSSDFPEGLVTEGCNRCTVNVIHRSLPHRRMLSALKDCLLDSSQLVKSICMGFDPPQEKFDKPPSSSLSIVKEHPSCGLKPLNQYQEKAVRDALAKPFTLVQGPPGTGKTVTGVHIAYWFAKRNMQLRAQDEECHHLAVDSNSSQHTKRLAPPQVIYCGPSNKSVDVVAHKMLKIPGIKILRVYGVLKEQAEFPIPNKHKLLRHPTDDEAQEKDEELEAVSLHHVIRRDGCPFADKLREFERGFKDDRINGVKTSHSDVKVYRKLIGEAEKWALQRVHIVLCTCVAAGRPKIATSCNIQQCIVDECGMCLEPESLVPMTCSEARQVVLIGDHKQLQPVIQDKMAETLGLNISMFERLSERALMLELQYRMHDKICRFPSTYFYDEKLKTDPSVPASVPLKSFWPENSSPMAFCHVEGEEEASAIKTSQSNEQSKANMKEVRKVVHVARLFSRRGVRPADVVVLTPYREQKNRISTALKREGMCKQILVTTIAKSQGSEWDYVILSLVRSGKTDDLDPEPSKHWLSEHLGFLTDEHQMNVGLTRARKGLCIIGNKHLLKHHPMWEKLLTFYEEKKCLVEESHWPKN